VDAETKRYISSQAYYIEGTAEKLIAKLQASMKDCAARGEIVEGLRGLSRHTGNIRKKIEFGTW
jgi:hypothetical protein